MKRSGSITAFPNPILLSDCERLGRTMLKWVSSGTDSVEVHIGAPDGPLLSRSGLAGGVTTGKWVTNGMVFYLQDVSGGSPLNSDHTLATVEVAVYFAGASLPVYSAMIGNWNYSNVEKIHYGDDVSYRKGIAFLDGHGTIEDWGCGFAHAKTFVKKSEYIGIDGSQSGFADKIADLREYTSNTDCILMRHVLEHNDDWRKVLSNAISSFKTRMALIIFTPMSEKTQRITTSRILTLSPVPDISFRKEDLTSLFKHLKYSEESLETDTQYKTEHIFYIEK
jgi:hypothetical protein